MSNTDFNNFNPLPTSDRNKQLEKLSIKAFNLALPVDKFTFRDERTDDCGVDGSLELEIDGKSTNLRAQVQLKATDSEEVNQDGSISIQITPANLNYLLNGQSPIYILYVAPRKQLYYVWARDERKRIDEINPTWTQQKTVKIRFKNLLNDKAIEEVHQRIRDEAQMQRQINDILSSASNIENAIIGINPETLEVTDSESAKEILLTSGRFIVNAGYPEKIRSLSKILDSKSETSPLILIVRAYAEQIIGNYLEAYALLAKAQLGRDELSEDDKQFLDTLQKNCEYLTGRISIQEFSSYLTNNKDQITGHFRQSYRINQLSYLIWTTADPYQIPEFINEFASLVQEILSDPTSSNVFKLYAKSVWLEVEGIDISSGYTRDIAGDQMKVLNGLHSSFEEINQRYNNRLKKWLIERNNAITEAEQLNHRSLIASLKFISALVTYHQMTGTYSLALLRRIPIVHFFEIEYKDDINISTEIAMNLINEAIDIFQQTGNIEGELRARMLIADFYEFSGRVSEAQEIAKEVLPKAEALAYVRQIEHAQEHIAGRGLKAKLDSSIRDKSFEERQLENANWSDERVRFLTTQMLRICELPNDRYPVLEREYSSIKRIAQERLNWCRYIELLQDKKHSLRKETMYKKDPNRVCVCNLHQYKSIIQNPNWEILIPAFKKTYCEQCPDRTPLEFKL